MVQPPWPLTNITEHSMLSRYLIFNAKWQHAKMTQPQSLAEISMGEDVPTWKLPPLSGERIVSSATVFMSTHKKRWKHMAKSLSAFTLLSCHLSSDAKWSKELCPLFLLPAATTQRRRRCRRASATLLSTRWRRRRGRRRRGTFSDYGWQLFAWIVDKHSCCTHTYHTFIECSTGKSSWWFPFNKRRGNPNSSRVRQG